VRTRAGARAITLRTAAPFSPYEYYHFLSVAVRSAISKQYFEQDTKYKDQKIPSTLYLYASRYISKESSDLCEVDVRGFCCSSGG
jgi:hypothetical protein